MCFVLYGIYARGPWATLGHRGHMTYRVSDPLGIGIGIAIQIQDLGPEV
jgi:hypothetical protein